MKIKISKWIWGIIALSIIGTAIIYPSLPPTIPSHWNINGQVNQYAGKSFAWFTALLPIAILLLRIVIPHIDPKKESYIKHQTAYQITMTLIVFFMIVIHWISILAALKYNVNMGMAISIALGVLFLVMGNYMRQIRHNYFFGIRTPWTLASDVVWTKTHRVGSVVYMIGGILFILGGLINAKYGMMVALAYIILSAVYLFVYSYIQYNRLQKKI